jgi:predicted RNase H-like nuclease (RuvC/YqgF family)
MVILFLERSFENIETDIIQLEVKNKNLNATIEEYKATIEEYKATIENMLLKNNETEEMSSTSYGEISDKKIETLAKENIKLQVRCDMLVEEIHKIREFPINTSHQPCI